MYTSALISRVSSMLIFSVVQLSGNYVIRRVERAGVATLRHWHLHTHSTPYRAPGVSPNWHTG